MLKLPHNCKLASTVCEPRTSDIQAGFRKGRGTSDQIVNILWITEKAREFQKKKSTSASLTMLKPLTLQSQSLLTSQQTVESSSTDRNTRPPYLPPERQKGMTEGEMVGWHHQLNGYELSKLQEMVKDREA